MRSPARPTERTALLSTRGNPSDGRRVNAPLSRRTIILRLTVAVGVLLGVALLIHHESTVAAVTAIVDPLEVCTRRSQ
jgi:hypothetical protein